MTQARFPIRVHEVGPTYKFLAMLLIYLLVDQRPFLLLSLSVNGG